MNASSRHDGDGLDGATARLVLDTMWRIRAFEERLQPLKRARAVHGLTHLSIGQEAVAAGVCQQLRDDEPVYSGHRPHGHALAKGVDMGRLMAELMGRADGPCKGLGGSIHLVDTAHGFLGATGVVGSNLPLAVGSALAGRRLGRPVPVVAFFGDGAAHTGIFAESVNLAGLWRLPVVFVCENNGIAGPPNRAAHTRVGRVADLAGPHAIPAVTVDGDDVGEVRRAFAEALGPARDGEGPFLLECLTHRLSGHYVGDPQAHRTMPGAEARQALDPIRRLVRRAAAAGWFDEDASAAAERAAREEVEAAVAFASASPPPERSLPAELTYAR